MKAIRAYVRERKAKAVVRALVAQGHPQVVATPVMAFGDALRGESLGFSGRMEMTYERIVLIEVICRDERVDETLETILRSARTGDGGDGAVFVVPIDVGVRIRDGARGSGILGQ